MVPPEPVPAAFSPVGPGPRGWAAAPQHVLFELAPGLGPRVSRNLLRPAERCRRRILAPPRFSASKFPPGNVNVFAAGAGSRSGLIPKSPFGDPGLRVGSRGGNSNHCRGRPRTLRKTSPFGRPVFVRVARPEIRTFDSRGTAAPGGGGMAPRDKERTRREPWPCYGAGHQTLTTFGRSPGPSSPAPVRGSHPRSPGWRARNSRGGRLRGFAARYPSWRSVRSIRKRGRLAAQPRKSSRGVSPDQEIIEGLLPLAAGTAGRSLGLLFFGTRRLLWAGHRWRGRA